MFSAVLVIAGSFQCWVHGFAGVDVQILPAGPAERRRLRELDDHDVSPRRQPPDRSRRVRGDIESPSGEPAPGGGIGRGSELRSVGRLQDPTIPQDLERVHEGFLNVPMCR